MTIRTLTFVIGALGLGAPVAAQVIPADTFYVTLVKKSPQHFSYGRIWDSCFALNGVEAAQPTLVRGATYVFQMVDIPRRAALILETMDNKQWFAGMSASSAWGDQTLTFTPPQATPPILRYESGWQFESGGWLHFVDSLTTDIRSSERSAERNSGSLVLPNPFSESAEVRYWIPGATTVRLDLFDELGRFVYSAEELSTEGTGRFRLNGRQIGIGHYRYRIVASNGGSVTGGLTVLR